MTIKSTNWIKQNKPIEPFISKQINIIHDRKIPSYGLSEAGYDFRLSNDFKPFKRQNSLLDNQITLSSISKENNLQTKLEKSVTYDLRARDSIFCSSMEIIDLSKMTSYVCATIINKLEIVERGLLLQQAHPIPPKYKGRINFIVSNLTAETITLYSEIGIGTLVFHCAED
jgi:deoxycytidine triphosphate deaminase